MHLQARFRVPRHVHPRSPECCSVGVRHGVAAGGDHAGADAPEGPSVDLVAVVGLVGLGALCWYIHIVTPEGADPWLFRGGFFLTGFATLS